MNIVDFLKKNPVNPQEEQICKNIYKNSDFTEQEWKNKLQNSVTFLPKKEDVKKPIEEKAEEIIKDFESEKTDKEVVTNKQKKK